MRGWHGASIAGGLLMAALFGPTARAQTADTAPTPPAAAYFPTPVSTPPEPAATGAPPAAPSTAPAAAVSQLSSEAPSWIQSNSTSTTGLQSCSMSADLGGSWSVGLLADQAQPTIFSLTISGPYAVAPNGAQRLTLYYDRGMQVLSGTANGSSISIPLDASNFPQFLHGFTSGRLMLIAEGRNPAFEVNLTGSSAAVAALGQCTEAEGFTQLPPPWHASPVTAQVTSSAARADTPTALSAYEGTETEPPPSAQTVSAGSLTANADAATPATVAADATLQQSSSADDGNGGSFLIGILIVIIGLVAWRVAVAVKRHRDASARDIEELRRRRLAQELVEGEIRSQASRLGIRRSQLVFNDFYGTPDLSRWVREVETFCATRIVPLLEREGLIYLWPGLADSTPYVIEQAALHNSGSPSVAPVFISNPAVFDPRMDPIDYERHCALLLRDGGWSATLTPTTGDQGADVIAEKVGVRLVVQCKLYGQPVGNDAVQQAFAAKNFQRAQMAAVVSNAPFTQSARHLAMTTGVLLLHHEELRTLEIENVYGGEDASGRG